MKGKLLLAILFAQASALQAQMPVQTGRGSYAAFPPTYKSRTADRGGSWATMMETSHIYADETDSNGNRRPIPTNDWWTDLLWSRYSGGIWSLPALVRTSADGVTVCYPSQWSDNGTEVVSRSSLLVSARGFSATEARAIDWHDWDVVMSLPGAEGGSIKATLVHGMPFTWFEYTDLMPQIRIEGTPEFFDTAGRTVASPDGRSGAIGIAIGSDLYGLYFAPGSASCTEGTVTLGNSRYAAVALLRSRADLASWQEYAMQVPRNTRVDWTFDEATSMMKTTWRVDTEDLRTGRPGGSVLQGFLPHVNKWALNPDFAYTGHEYLTPRGSMRLAAGNTFSYSRRFPGILPHYAAPANAGFNPAILSDLTTRYASGGTFGADTYWGGKGLVQMALNMTFALEAGDNATFETSRAKLRAALEDWLTYTPGELQYFFTAYPRWGAMVGYDVSYDSDKFNDHHFHYGYIVYAGALLCMHDPDFREGYGEMLRLIAKDYANWDRTDSRFPFLRTLDPWVGHSYAGGLGDHLNDNSNGQESSSEAMQGWGGVYMLGVALDDREMRDAGIFGWLTESAAVAEYWFDRDHIRGGGNYDYSLYKHPYCTNITSKGIGWWTWFSGDPIWMHSIQWMPVSPCLSYMSQDLDFVRWDYDTFMRDSNYDWFENSTRGEEKLDPLANQSVGNVVLSYMERGNPELAAQIFDRAYAEGFPIARNIDTGHISYFVIHNHLTYGDPDFTVYADIPTAACCRRADGTVTYMVYNPGSEERDVTFYRDGARLATWRVPATGRVVCFTTPATPASIEVTSAEGAYVAPGTSSRITARTVDNYGATYTALRPVLSLAPGTPATLSADGLLTMSPSAPKGSLITITATAGSLTASYQVKASPAPAVASATITPAIDFSEMGTPLAFAVDATDTEGNAVAAKSWRISDATGAIVAETASFTPTRPGRYTVEAVVGATSVSHSFTVTPQLPNLALGRPAVSSGEENAGCVTASATDGLADTRWGSPHTDSEWIYVDLGRDCRIVRTDILWETAHAADYVIETAPDGCAMTPFTAKYAFGDRQVEVPAQWTAAKTVTGLSHAGSDSQTLSATGRYLRIRGLSRATVYGYSLYELRVHGLPFDADLSAPAGLEIEAPILIQEGETAELSARQWTLGGESKPAEVTWGSSLAGTFSGNAYTPAAYGLATITATTADGLSAEARVLVAESVKPASISVTPDSATVIVGMPLHLDVTVLNQFDGLWHGEAPEPVIYDISVPDEPHEADGVTYEGGVFTADLPGDYLLDFGNTRARINARSVADVNLAYGKAATASGSVDGNTASKAVDGLVATRWESPWVDDHNLTVDLADTYVLNRVVILWEGAYAADYSVLTSLDGESWAEVWATTAGTGGRVTAEFPQTPARYVRLQCNRRATGYGNSVYELEVYGTSRYSSIPGLPGPEAVASAEYYNLQGVRVSSGHLCPGLYIRRCGGVAAKILIKKSI